MLGGYDLMENYAALILIIRGEANSPEEAFDKVALRLERPFEDMKGKRKQHRSVTEYDIQLMVKEKFKGMSYTEIATKYGLSKNSVSGHIKRYAKRHKISLDQCKAEQLSLLNGMN